MASDTFFNLLTRDVMTKTPVTVGATDTVEEVATKMYESDIRHIPVVEDRALIGIISDRDLRSFASAESSSEASLLDSEPSSTGKVSDIVHTDVIAVNPETSISELVDLMVDEKVGAIPVIEERDRILVGIVSYVDILKAVRDSRA